jgi:TrbL/VirB6 plasmid conjugal transfer protein
VRAKQIALASCVAIVALAGAGARAASAAPAAHAGRIAPARGARPAPRPSSPEHGHHASSTAPSSPPLTTGAGGSGATSSNEEATSGASQAVADPLVSNGLGSPTCKGELGGELSHASRRNCETSGFVAAPAPTGDYGIDVHIDTGVLGFGSGALLSIVQDVVVTPLWMALVWAVHALLVMLEWCFSIDLFNGAAASGLGGDLRAMQAALTEPWLALALAVASVLVLYHGLIRRRVAETLGEALVMGVMMAGGIWVIVDPTGTIGALSEWANRASLGTLAVTATGTPADPGRALGNSLGTLFAAAIEVPWCYLEFGDVGWCREPSRLDPRLRAAALKIAAEEISQVGCTPRVVALVPCVPAGSAAANALERSAELLRDARSNGAIFLALPANGPARNSINEPGSLLRTLCQTSEATDCSGPTAAQAEFRTNSGTWPRLGGVLLIAGGLLGMLLLLGFVAVRLLVAAIFALLYLLLAPAIVLAPAFGDGGRALFRRWAARLLGAAVSKLMFSFLLGVVLAVLAILSELDALGWWTQWLLMSAFWWSAYTHRHQALGAAGAALADRGAGSAHVQRRSLARRMSEALETPRKGIAAARWAKGKFEKGAPEQQQRARAQVGRERARAGMEEQVSRALEGEYRDAQQHADAAPDIQRHLAGQSARVERMGRERADALAGGDTRRAAEIGHREARVRGEIKREQEALSSAQKLVRDGEQAQRRGGEMHSRERREAHERLLDAQAALPAGAKARGGGERRDYAALAALAGFGRAEYEQLDPRRRRAARLEIDRELALRKELGATARTLESPQTARLRGRERRKAEREFDGTLQRRMNDARHSLPASHTKRSSVETWRAAGRANAGVPSSASSSVMRDAFEVAARRKRQLGKGRP